MPTSFDLNTYDLLQRAISTAQALHELGTAQQEAAFEATETVLDDRDDSISEQAYLTEAIVATGPVIDATITDNQFEQSRSDGTVSDTVTALLEAVLTAATYTDAFDPVMVNAVPRPAEPQETYDAAPAKLLAVLRDDAAAFLQETDPTDVDGTLYEAAADHVVETRSDLATLPYTPLAIVLDHLVTEHDIDPVVDAPSITPETHVTDVGVACLKAALATYFRAEVPLESQSP